MIKKETILSISICGLLSFTIAAGIQYSFSFYQFYQFKNSKHYDSRLAGQTTWLGPKIGEKLDLGKLKDRYGHTLSENISDSLKMLLVINPECHVSNYSTDQMRAVEKESKSNAVDFAVVSFDPAISLTDLLKFKETAVLNSSFYFFDGTDPELKMQFHAFILTDSDGIILRVFAGSHENAEIRDVMSKEIIKDVLEQKKSLDKFD